MPALYGITTMQKYKKNIIGNTFSRFIFLYVLSYKNNDITYQCCHTEQGVNFTSYTGNCNASDIFSRSRAELML